METILIATDFSYAARNATRYGFELSKTMNAKVILFNAYQLPSTHPESMVYLPTVDLEKSSYEQLANEAETFDSHATVVLETHCGEGPVGKAILSAATANNVSFIVIGMKGKGHGKEIRKYFGSTVTLLGKQSSIPIVVVPEEASFAAPNTIALANDIDHETNIQILEPLKKIAITFNAAVSIVRVIKKSMNEAVERLLRSERLESFVHNLKHSYEYLKDENVAKAMNDFVEQNAVDLIAVLPQEHTFMERLFTRSVTKDLIFHSHVPLLILPPVPHDDAKSFKGVYTSDYIQGVY